MSTEDVSQLSLSSGVLIYILTFLDGRDIVRFCTTNRAFYRFYKKSYFLQSLVQLDVCGAEACLGPHSFDPRKRLSYMKTRESLWQFADPNLPALRPRTRRDPGPFTQLMGVDEDIFWFGLGTNIPRVVRALQFSNKEREALWRNFVVGETSEDIKVVDTCLAVQEHNLIAILTLPPLT